MESTSFLSGSRPIGLQYQRAAHLQAPALLLLHGAGGVDSGQQYIRQVAAALVRGGCSVFLVEYFDRTRTERASLQEMQENFEVWLETITHAVDFIIGEKLAETHRLGTVGYSLGGYLAVAHASRDPRIRAVAEIAGGIDPTFAQGVHRMPPLLIIHGEEDLRVPFSNALDLANLARSLETPVQTDFYPGERHVLSLPAAQQALANLLAFFGKFLG